MAGKKKQIKGSLNGEMKDKFHEIKKRHGFRTNAETVRYMIAHVHRQEIEETDA